MRMSNVNNFFLLRHDFMMNDSSEERNRRDLRMHLNLGRSDWRKAAGCRMAVGIRGRKMARRSLDSSPLDSLA